MSDHAGDVARRIKRGYLGHPWNGGDGVSESTEDSDRAGHAFRITTSDGGAFRIIVENCGYEGLAEHELQLANVKLDENDPLYVAPEPVPPRHTHRLLANGELEPIPSPAVPHDLTSKPF